MRKFVKCFSVTKNIQIQAIIKNSLWERKQVYNQINSLWRILKKSFKKHESVTRQCEVELYKVLVLIINNCLVFRWVVKISIMSHWRLCSFYNKSIDCGGPKIITNNSSHKLSDHGRT